MNSLKKKILTLMGVVAISVWVAFNLNIIGTNGSSMDILLSNVEALARGEGEGYFPLCQKKEGDGVVEKIPFCVDGKCQKVEEKKGTLDVNYCSQ